MQPKRVIAEYIEENGFLVPKRYPDLETALDSRRNFIVRSEHPQDYYGASGLGFSLLVESEAISRCITIFLGASDKENGWEGSGLSRREYKAGRIISRLVRGQEGVEKSLTDFSFEDRKRFCRLTGQSLEDFSAKISYSYWELMPGVNRTIAADNAIEGRYHIFSTAHKAPWGYPINQFFNYLILEDCKIIAGEAKGPSDTVENLGALVDTYESIRNLPRFPQGHCPTMEFQDYKSKFYFLQYLRGLDFKAATFRLERDPDSDELVAIHVRGASPVSGLLVNAAIRHDKTVPAQVDEAEINYFLDPMMIEAFARQRTLQLVWETPGKSLFSEDKGHMPRSLLLKPQISAVFPYKDLESLHTDVRHTKADPLPHAQFLFTSDGRKAYLKRLR